MLARHRQAHPREQLATTGHLPASPCLVMPKIGDVPIRVGMEPISLNLAESLCNTLSNILATIERYNPPTPGNKVHKAFERSLDSIEVGINVSMIKFHMRQNRSIREIVQKLRPLVEERRIVLIAFNQKRLQLLPTAGGATFESPA